MSHSPRPRVRREDSEESDPRENIELSYDRPRPNDRLALTSKLHPFWKTKNGLAIVVLVILVFIGAIVGGAIGGSLAGVSDSKGNLNGSTSSASEPTPSATSTTNSSTI